MGKSTMYDEIAGVPLICAGPSFPKGKVINTPVSHVDVCPTVMDIVGESFDEVQDDHPGVSLIDLSEGATPERTVISEYHGMGSTSAAYMIRVGKYKYIHYSKYAPQLFDLEADPDEINDLANDSSMSAVLEECKKRLHDLLDPMEVDKRARARQKELLDANGGREAVIARGDLGFTPAPGVAADFK